MSALLRDLEELFAHSEQRVLAAFVAVKCDPTTAGSRSRRALPKSTGKPRVICLTAKRRTKKRGFKGTLHVCKLSQGRYQVRKSIRLKLLCRLEAFVDSPGQQEYLELTFQQRGFTSGEARMAFEVRNAAVRLELLGTLYTFCRAHEWRAPLVAGIEISELESSAAQYNKQVADANVGATARVLLKEATREEAAVGGEEDAGDDALANPLWGQREDKQIQSLLEMVSGGSASMEELQQRLETELAALEDASVHEILENGGQVSRVLGALGGALGLLDDLEQNLGIFDARLRHMREDIAAIEERNNQLELHSRNNQMLLGTLDGLVGRLSLSESAERALQAREVTAANLPQAVAAAWELHGRLQALQPELPDGTGGAASAAGSAGAGVHGSCGGGGSGLALAQGPLPRSMDSMAAVASQRQRLHSLQRTFVDRATAFLQQELAHVADAAMQRLGGPSGAAALGPGGGLGAGAGAGGLYRGSATSAAGATGTGTALADHASLRRRAEQLAPLLEVVGALRPAAVVAPREAYCQAVNALLRQEVHVAAAEVRRMAAAADAAGTQEPDLLARPSAAEAASMLERLTSPCRSPLAQPSGRDLTAAYRQAGVVPIHEGYQSLLDSRLPMLAEEAAQCIALMFPKAASGSTAADGAAAAVAAGGPGGATKSVRFAAGGEAAAAATAAGAGAPPPVDVGSAEVQSTVASLLTGIDGELLGLIDGVRPARGALCLLPMLGATLAWRQRLVPRGASCRPLLALLGRLEGRLGAALAAFFGERTAAIQRYDGRASSVSVGGGGAKAQHVLPFILALPAVAARIEELLQRWPVQQQGQQQGQAAAAEAGQCSQPPLPQQQQVTPVGNSDGRLPRPPPSPFESSGGGGGGGSSTRQGAAAPAWRRGPRVSAASELSTSSLPLSSEAEEISFMEDEEEEGGADSAGPRRSTDASSASAEVAAQQAQQHQQRERGLQEPGPGDKLREIVDAGYEAWLTAMCGAVEALGAADAKHGARLRLENYAFLQLALQSLPLGRSPVLEGFAVRTEGLVGRAMGEYAEQQVENIKLARALEFSRRLDELLGSVGSEEVHLQPQFQPGDVRQLLAAAGSGMDKRLAQVRQRILKHLAATSPHLVDPVWHKLEGVCLERWGRMEEQLALCYRGIELRPTAEELRRLFRAAKVAGAAA